MENPEKCKTCGFNPASRPMGALHKDNPMDVKLTNDYCKEYTIPDRHKVVTIWKKCCGYLDHYNVIITTLDKPLWKI